MKKLLFIPMDFKYNPHQSWFSAFRKHFDTMYYSNQESAMEFSPDFIFAQSTAIGKDEAVEIKNKAKSFVMQWTGDCRPGLLPEVINYKNVADITFLASGVAQKEMYESALEHPVSYLQHAVTDEQFIPVDENPLSRILFIGNNYGQFPGAVERSELCRLLKKEFGNGFEVMGSGYNSEEYGFGAPISYADTPVEYNRSNICVSANIYNDYEGYWSNRPLDIMAAGSLCLMRYTPNMEKYFTDGEHCLFYRNNAEAIEKIKSLSLVERNIIATAGQKLAREKHTYESRVTETMSYIKHLL